MYFNFSLETHATTSRVSRYSLAGKVHAVSWHVLLRVLIAMPMTSFSSDFLHALLINSMP